MSETVEVPILGWGREQTQAWTQAVTAVASLVRQRRMELGRHAWGSAEDAARHHDRIRKAATPAVRVMNEQERALFEQQRADGAASPTMDTRHVDGRHGSVTVTVGALGEDNGWGLAAYGRSADGGQAYEARVRCVDEATAKRLADDLLGGSPDRLERLEGFATLAADRAAAAAGEVREPEAQRLARTAAAIREAWSPALAERVIFPTERQRARGDQWNPAFGALAWRLHEMEERGYSMTDVLSRIAEADLSEAGVRNPAALAEYFVEEMMGDLQVINLSDHDPGGWVEPVPAPEPVSVVEEPDPAVRARHEAVESLLGDALPAEVLDKVRHSAGFDRMRDELAAQHEQGRPIARLLSDLAVDKIDAANDPASYLAAIVRRRVAPEALRPTQVDRVEMAGMVERGLPRATADKVVACQGWPGLAARLDAWQNEGLPVVDMLESLPAGRIATARTPAAYTAALMNAKATNLRAQAEVSEDSPGHDRRDRGARRPDSAVGATTDSGAPRAGTGPSSDEDLDLSWTDSLDPTSPVDRVGLESAVGLGSPARDAQLEARLRGSGSGVDSGAAGHVAAADAAEARAARREQEAAYERATPDDPDTTEREDLDGYAAAHGDEHLAAGQRAIAAEQQGLAAAAAARAEVTYSPPEPEQPAPQGPARRGRPPAAGRPVRTPKLTQGQERGRGR